MIDDIVFMIDDIVFMIDDIVYRYFMSPFNMKEELDT